MSIIPIILGTCCALCAIQLTLALTSQEASWFDSEEIAVLPDPDIHGSVMVDTANGVHTLISNGIPDHAVGNFAGNNNILEHSFRMSFPQNPALNDEPTCLPSSSIIGFATNGVAIFSPFDENSMNTNVDFGNSCQGQTSTFGIYYYTQVPNQCSTYIPNVRGHDPSRIYGVALDGFPIYGPGTGDNKITNADLDACHGKMVDGKYRYYMTDEWPYVLGCFLGTPVSVIGAPTVTGVCKFACNKDSLHNTVSCVDDFTTPTAKPTTVKPHLLFTTNPYLPTPSSQPTATKQIIGITNEEVMAFTSNDAYVEQNTLKTGFAKMVINSDSESFTFVSNGIPDHATAPYPNDKNPYKLVSQNFELDIPRYPEYNVKPSCLPSPGVIGFATNGVALFSPYDAKGRDVNINRINGRSDLCQGQTSASGIYHYTELPDKCVHRTSNPNHIYGVALDGFPIYGPGDPPVKNEDLDICHGRIVNGQYRYHMTREFPYILGCFRGAPQKFKKVQGMQTVPQFEDSCRFACNLNRNTSKTDRRLCNSSKAASYHNLLLSSSLPVLFAILLKWL